MIKAKCHIKKDDKVKILTGKDEGKIGKVLRVIHKKNRVLVENVNIMKRHQRPSGQQRQGGIIETESPLHWSNVMLMCNKCLKPSKIKIKRLDDGRKVRTCKKCGEVIDS